MIKIERTPLFLMANLGSDMSQLFLNLEKNDEKFANMSAVRAEKIVNELLAMPEMKSRVVEIEVIKDVIKDALSEKPLLNINKNQIEEYFMPFALRLMSV